MAFNGDHFLEKKFLELKKRFNIEVVLETGSFLGDTTKWFAQNFEQVYSCDIVDKHFKAAQQALKDHSNARVFLMSSPDFLDTFLPVIERKCLIFLDAHWFENPLLQELSIIAKSKIKPVIAIHDFKVPDKNFGYDTYLDQGITYEWSYIAPSIETIFGNKYKVEYNTETADVNRGCVFILPTQ